MRELLAKRWNEIGDKIVQLADAVPEGEYERRAAPDVRTFADQLRHVAFWNQYTRDTLRGGAPDGAANELPRAAYREKSAIVAVLRSSFAEVAAEIAKRPARLAESDVDTIVSFVEHNGEHYGQLVVYARLSAVVPPASRPAMEAGVA